MIVKAGRQWLVARDVSDGHEIVHYDPEGKEAARYKVTEGMTLVLGRAAPATILKADDLTVSRRHLSVTLDSGRLSVRGSRRSQRNLCQGSESMARCRMETSFGSGTSSCVS